jgi:hypothetical protein
VAKANGWIKDREFRDFSQETAVMSLAGLAPEMVNKLREKAYRNFYYRPAALYRLFKMISVKGLFKAITGGLKFIVKTGL